MYKGMKILITIDDISRLYGLSKATINYYTNMGLLHIADRDGNKRLYNEREIRSRVEKIKEMRKTGYSLRLIRKQFSHTL